YVISDPTPSLLLFSIHTYYAIFMKLLAAEIVSSISPLFGSFIQNCVKASSDKALLMQMESVEAGGIFAQVGIKNFLEGDLFSWYLSAWNGEAATVIRRMVEQFDKYDVSTLSVEPAETQDLLKYLYHHLFPRTVRHDLGEYYTADWLAEYTIERSGFDGNPDIRVLDPACGSGTFLVSVLNVAK